jgi:glutamine synthetase
LRTFIDTTAEVQRAMGFENEKDHPEVAPSQFEINYGYGESSPPPTRSSSTN